MKTVFIYALCEPGTRTIRYIGQTHNLKKRFSRHLRDSTKKKSYLGRWLRSLSAEPVLIVLHEVREGESWAEEERRYISCARAIGISLVNGTEGGEGAPGYVHTLETRSAMVAAWTPERRAANSARHKGVPESPEARAALSAAKKGVLTGPLSPEHRAAVSRGLTGLPKTSEHRAAISASWTPERRAANSARHKGVPNSPEQNAALTGRTRTSEHCEALSAAWTPERRAAQIARQKGGTLSPEHCAAMSAARKGVPWSPAQRAAFERKKAGLG